MPLAKEQVEKAISELTRARKGAVPCEPPSSWISNLTLEDAYAISRRQIQKRTREDNERHVGFKVGLSSAASQERYSVSAPTFGFLTNTMEVQGSISRAKMLAPKAEGEIVFFLGKDLPDRVILPEEFAEAVDHVRMGIEIVDMRVGRPPYKVQDHVADNSFACGYVLGSARRALGSLDLTSLFIRGSKNGLQATSGYGREIMGTPVHSATWLANKLFALGERLRAGQLIFSGAFGDGVPFDRGDELCFSSEGFDTVKLLCKS